MMKRIVSLLLALLLLPILPAMAEENTAACLEWVELNAWAQSYKEKAMTLSPLNDPTAPEAKSEDGYAFIYEFGTLYMDRPEMTENSVLKELVITSPEETAPRQTRVDMFVSEIIGAFYNENDGLAGDRGFAALYAANSLPSGAVWGWVQRDGQRIMSIQYACHDQLSAGGEGYTDAGLIYTIQNDIVAAIRAYGLDAVIDEADAQDNLSAVQAILVKDEYRQVPVSYLGTDLEPFSPADLIFSGIDYLALTPESAAAALGECREDHWMEDDTGEYIRTMEFPGCEITFVYDKNKENPVADGLTILADGMEGPRCVRIGDTFASVLTRFRYNEGEYADMKEILYGTEGQAPYAMAEYGEDASATLRYVCKTASGQEAVLYMNFVHMSLSEILIFIND